MSSLTDRDASAAPRAIRRARLAPLLAWAAAAAGIFVVAAFVLKAGLLSHLAPDDGKPTVATVENPDRIASYDSTMTGVDKNNQPYRITASRGWQDGERPELFHLETMVAEFRKSTGEIYDVRSKLARYDKKAKRIELEGDVVITEPDRLTARMARASIDVKEKRLTSDVPVDVTFGDGAIRANGLVAGDDGADILFFDGVRAHFEIRPAKGDSSP
jgi:lipopolysaccharide export system protein LptC